MSSIISSGKLENIFLDSLTISSVAANAGDKIIVFVSTSANKDLGALTWGGQTATVIGNIANVIYALEIVVGTTGTNNIAAPFTGYTNYNVTYAVVRPTAAFDGAATPVISQFYANYPATGSLGSPANPSLTSASLGTNGRVLDCLQLGRETIGGVDFGSTTAVSTTTQLQLATNTNITPNITVMSTATGVGATISGYTITPSAIFYYLQVAIKETSFVITSVNGGTAVKPGQTSVAVLTSGFTTKPTSATFTNLGNTYTCTVNGGGTAGSFTINMPDRVTGQPWPTDGATIVWSFSNSVPEIATISGTITRKAGESLQSPFAGAITGDPTYVGYYLAQDGLTVNGGEGAYKQLPGMTGVLVLAADTGNSGSGAGDFELWFRPSTGTGAGNDYYYLFTINDAGQVTGVIKSSSTYIGIRVGI